MAEDRTEELGIAQRLVEFGTALLQPQAGSERREQTVDTAGEQAQVDRRDQAVVGAGLPGIELAAGVVRMHEQHARRRGLTSAQAADERRAVHRAALLDQRQRARRGGEAGERRVWRGGEDEVAPDAGKQVGQRLRRRGHEQDALRDHGRASRCRLAPAAVASKRAPWRAHSAATASARSGGMAITAAPAASPPAASPSAGGPAGARSAS